MAVLTSTGITFSDSSTLASAAPAYNAVGDIKYGIYSFSQFPSTNNAWNYTHVAPNTNIAGSSILSDFYVNTGTSYLGYVSPFYVLRSYVGTKTTLSIPGSGFNSSGNPSTYALYLFGGEAGVVSGTNTSYTTNSGTWRAMNGLTSRSYFDTGKSSEQALWYGTFWIRVA